MSASHNPEHGAGSVRPRTPDPCNKASAWAMPESELAALPGFSHDIAAARAEARRLLMEAGGPDLKLTLLVRGIPMPHFAGADLLAESWHEVGVTTTQQRLDIWEWQKIID